MELVELLSCYHLLADFTESPLCWTELDFFNRNAKLTTDWLSSSLHFQSKAILTVPEPAFLFYSASSILSTAFLLCSFDFLHSTITSSHTVGGASHLVLQQAKVLEMGHRTMVDERACKLEPTFRLQLLGLETMHFCDMLL